MKKNLLPAALVGAAAAGYLVWANSAPVTTEYIVRSSKLPTGFDGYRIAHITDLHNADFGRNHAALMACLGSAAPDIIVITGDMIDARRTDIPCALRFAEQAVEIAPVYYVMGNHETRIPDYPKLEAGLLQLGVRVLHSEAVTLAKNGDTITLIGMDDPSGVEDFNAELTALTADTEGFTLLLSHRPERIKVYAQCSIDLALCGHAHGGQVRIPGIGGVIAPHQGFFPTYDGGMYHRGRTTMILSRGIGNSLCPLRVNNRPEVVVVELNTT